MAKTDFKSVDEYIATHPKDVQLILHRVLVKFRAQEVIAGAKTKPVAPKKAPVSRGRL